MTPRYFIQLPDETEPRGPLTGGAVRRMIENGECAGHEPFCLEGDAQWGTLNDYWEEFAAPAAVPARTVHAAIPVRTATPAAFHPALQREPLPIWKIVVGVVCFLEAVGGIIWIVWMVPAVMLGNKQFFIMSIIAGILSVVFFMVGLKLTARK